MYNDYQELITVKELQKMLGIGKNTAYSLLKQNKIKCFRIGKLWKIPKGAVQEYILTKSHLN
ncbi:MAG: helix-turn-helix domain-containing protein [Clostridiales bacterium]|nr:helix-turn-helix domain-containing protein [Clostridiales bacterium]